MSEPSLAPVILGWGDIRGPVEALDGSRGALRRLDGPRTIGARNDFEAIQDWLACYQDWPESYRTYRREAERLLLWAVCVHAKPLSSLVRDDFLAYQAFMKNPQPAERWCGRNSSKTPRGSPGWKPFVKGLSDDAVRQSMIIINSLLGWLVQAGYLTVNSLSIVRKRRQSRARSQEEQRIKIEGRLLDHDTWRCVIEHVDRPPAESDAAAQAHHERRRFLIRLAYLTAARRSEIAAMQGRDFYYSRGRWWVKILGKGDKLRTVPVTEELVAAMKRYRRSLGLADMPLQEEKLLIVRSLSGKAGVSDKSIYLIVREAFRGAAQEAEEAGNHAMADHLRRSSTHWLRHTSISHQLDAGIDVRTVGQNAGHSTERTTRIYDHLEKDRRHDDTSRLRLPKASGEKA